MDAHLLTGICPCSLNPDLYCPVTAVTRAENSRLDSDRARSHWSNVPLFHDDPCVSSFGASSLPAVLAETKYGGAIHRSLSRHPVWIGSNALLWHRVLYIIRSAPGIRAYPADNVVTYVFCDTAAVLCRPQTYKYLAWPFLEASWHYCPDSPVRYTGHGLVRYRYRPERNQHCRHNLVYLHAHSYTPLN